MSRTPCLPVSEQLSQLRHGTSKIRALPRFSEKLEQSELGALRSTGIEILQINVGKLCNQTCSHCHVDAGPTRREIMDRETFEECLRILKASPQIRTVDLTGGAPEMNPHFRWFVAEARKLEKEVLVRCNLTILSAGPAYADLPEFFAEHQVEVVSSLPHYTANWTDRQRGNHVFEKSLTGLKKLNALGYGTNPQLRLNLVTNPVGVFLPGDQLSLEADFKRELLTRHQIHFNRLFTITNMPISRFLDALLRAGKLEDYLEKLVQSFNPTAALGVMCKNTLSVSWDGKLFDCDFNQMLELPVLPSEHRTVQTFQLDSLQHRPIAVDQHCYGCTAGAGSSCGGATT